MRPLNKENKMHEIHELSKRLKGTIRISWSEKDLDEIVTQWAKERAEWLKEALLPNLCGETWHKNALDKINQAFQIEEETIEEKIAELIRRLDTKPNIEDKHIQEIIQAVREYDKKDSK